jgi:hypothetical protein
MSLHNLKVRKTGGLLDTLALAVFFGEAFAGMMVQQKIAD